MTEQNAYQVADWNGQSGERWVAYQARLDAMLAVFGQAAIEAAAPAAGERVLDVGCGAGASSLALAARVGAGGQVLGVDISEPLIARARALTPQDTPVLFRVADASSAELPEGAFDILFSRFGVMFFDDPTGAFAHMRRALKPGARVAFVCWRGMAENDWVRLPSGAIKGIVPPTAPPDPEAPGPFSFGDRGARGTHPDGSRLHRYRYRALRCFHPVRRGRDAGRGDRRRGGDGVRGRPAVARAR